MRKGKQNHCKDTPFINNDAKRFIKKRCPLFRKDNAVIIIYRIAYLETGEEKVILFNLSGHGLIDMAAYDQYIAGNLQNYSISDEELKASLKDADALNQ